ESRSRTGRRVEGYRIFCRLRAGRRQGQGDDRADARQARKGPGEVRQGRAHQFRKPHPAAAQISAGNHRKPPFSGLTVWIPPPARSRIAAGAVFASTLLTPSARCSAAALGDVGGLAIRRSPQESEPSIQRGPSQARDSPSLPAPVAGRHARRAEMDMSMDQTANRKAAPSAAAPALSDREKNVIIAGVLLSMLLAALDQTIVAPAMPTIGASLGDAHYLPWIVTGYLLTATAIAPLYGKISDIHGRRVTIHAAILIFLAGSIISALAPNMLALIAGRAVQGLGGGGLFAMSQTVIGDLVPPRERARYAAWISGTWAVASVAGPLLGGAFAEHMHWSLI